MIKKVYFNGVYVSKNTQADIDFDIDFLDRKGVQTKLNGNKLMFTNPKGVEVIWEYKYRN